MDDLDRTFRRLVSVIRAEYPSYLDKPFELSELYQSVIPYRHHRRELGFETNQDYELAMMRLLSGARGYVIGDTRMQERLRQELTSSNPDTSIFRAFATTMVSLDPEAVRRIEGPDADSFTAERSRGEAPPAAAAAVAAARRPEGGEEGAASRPSGERERADEQTVVFRRAPEAPAAAAGAMAAGGPAMSVSSSGPTPTPNIIRPGSQGPAVSAPSRAASPPADAERPRETAREPLPESSRDMPREMSREMPRDVPRETPREAAPRDFDRDAAVLGERMAEHAAPGGGFVNRPPAAPPPRPTQQAASASGAADANASFAAGRAQGTTPQGATAQRGLQTIVASGTCRYCGGELPDGRRITFCPHCGQNLTIQHCPACGTELELAWKFCTTCGRAVGPGAGST